MRSKFALVLLRQIYGAALPPKFEHISKDLSAPAYHKIKLHGRRDAEPVPSEAKGPTPHTTRGKNAILGAGKIAFLSDVIILYRAISFNLILMRNS